jgi:radical SAM superfamily enzyme YgiQ (UPF0313 family)
MSSPVFLITPPFTQLNTPYPATAYIKGFLNTKGIPSVQADLGIEVTLALFNKAGLAKLIKAIRSKEWELSSNCQRILALENNYINTIDQVILFLQGNLDTIAHLICSRTFLPEGDAFDQMDDLDWAFGAMGKQDKAKHIATMYLEDLGNLIKETIDPHFGFSRYAESLGRSANTFDELYAALNAPVTYLDTILLDILEQHIQKVQPKLVCISVPFPGNLYTSLRCGQWLKQHHPNIKVAMGGGFANTELRSLSDPRVFEFYDFITLDDGETPLELLIDHIDGKKEVHDLKRCFTLLNGVVTYINESIQPDYKQHQLGTPDYDGLWLDQYISVIELVNPMHSLWSDGRWNKLTMAHGCYWGKCTFCDISLDYIKTYEPATASLLADRMELMIAQTGQNGFHFVDEAAPPALMKALAIEIIKRKLVVSWWANVRFEKSFTQDLCYLLKASGCIAVSGGLEVASDRLLDLIQKGITVAQVARVSKHFNDAGIMVHAYLMYGFPTQTVQETVDSLEMVRQLFETGVLKSAFWHLFTMTAHSPVGLAPEKYKVKKVTDVVGSFANNDIAHIDTTGANHEIFGYGLKKAILNYMHGACFEFPLQKWFDFKIPKTSIAPNYIQTQLDAVEIGSNNYKAIWIGLMPTTSIVQRAKKGSKWEEMNLRFETNQNTISINVDPKKGIWFTQLLEKINVDSSVGMPLIDIKADYMAAGLEDFDLFWDNKPINTLHKAGLLRI